VGARRDETIEAFVEAYGTLGFRLCFDGSLVPGVEKLAIFGIDGKVICYLERPRINSMASPPR
jgi:hypothetical protein